MKRIFYFLFIGTIILASCEKENNDPDPDGQENNNTVPDGKDTTDVDYFTITYDLNNGSGEVPIDTTKYSEGDLVVIKHNIGGLKGSEISTNIYERFLGWSESADGSVVYEPNDYFKCDSNKTLYAVYTEGTSPDSVIGMAGQAGGLIVYDAGETKNWGRYIEAAPVDVSTSNASWGRADIDINGLDNITDMAPLSISRLEGEIGKGGEYSDIIISVYEGENYAINLCMNYTIGEYDDWVLPSIGEVDLIYNNLYMKSIGNFQTEEAYLGYLSSTELDMVNIWQLIFKQHSNFTGGEKAGEAHGVRKDEFYSVRPIRYFN